MLRKVNKACIGLIINAINSQTVLIYVNIQKYKIDTHIHAVILKYSTTDRMCLLMSTNDYTAFTCSNFQSLD